MATENSSSPILKPELYENWDDEEEIRWKAPLEALMNGTQTPLQAAKNIDNLLRAETTLRLQKLIDYTNSHSLTVEEREHGDWGGLYAPNASLFAQNVLRSYCRVCTAFSPYSEGQNRLIELLVELKNLPRWMAPESRPDENGHVLRTEFWAFGYKWIGLEDEFRRQDAGYYRDAAAHNRWRNLQHAMARITASKLIYCAPFNALQDIVPDSEPHGKRNLEYDIIAAGQWVIWPTECRYVFEECLKRKSINNYWEAWSEEGWSQWKREFRLVIESEQYDADAQSVARRALQQMNAIEVEFSGEINH
ncbi:hypothetical protein GQ44DRAFT_801160 [Phaeosphaeriaceae sp. PMI808]|nr:hypothetical protein GQ44DRAFT_801160 [Phaeosphaeriaceae sp. PMI808]